MHASLRKLRLGHEPKEIQWEELTFGDQLDAGGAFNAGVFKGRWGSRQVAIKTFPFKGLGSRVLRELQDDAQAWQPCECSRCASLWIRLHAAARGVGNGTCLALSEALSRGRDAARRFSVEPVAKQIALSMRAIHDAGILHNDLRAKRIAGSQAARGTH